MPFPFLTGQMDRHGGGLNRDFTLARYEISICLGKVVWSALTRAASSFMKDDEGFHED